MDDEAVTIHRVAIDVCENCLNGVTGQCHVPGCMFIWHNIEETPQPLRYMIAYHIEGECRKTV